jgi:hemerythrin
VGIEAPRRTTGPVLLGYGPIDHVHAEFDTLLGRAMACPDDELAACVDALAVHLHGHFATEDGWMRETAFPAGDCHIQEHAAVLASADEVLARVAQGDLRVARAFVEELARWFPGHADYLDSALAAWMSKRQFGGQPVVLHRKPVA